MIPAVRKELTASLREAERRKQRGLPAQFRALKPREWEGSGSGYHEVVEHLEMLRQWGVLELKSGTGGNAHNRTALKVINIDRLAEHLGLEKLQEAAGAAVVAARKGVEYAFGDLMAKNILGRMGGPQDTVPSNGSLKSWRVEVDRILREAESQWLLGKAYKKLDRSKLTQIEHVFCMASAILNGNLAGTDPRTFSLHTAGDTKALERNMGSVLMILRDIVPLPDDDMMALSAFGIERYPHATQMLGPVEFVLPDGRILPGDVGPSSSIHPDHFRGARWIPGEENGPRRILTIENRTSFEQHVRSVKEAGCLVIFSSGFVRPSVVGLIRELLRQDPTATLHHWGDIDVGGLTILSHLEEATEVTVHPHLMTKELAEANGVKRDGKFARLMHINDRMDMVGEMARYLQAGGMMLEQEALMPERVAA